MTHRARIQIAAAVTAVFLGGLIALGIGVNSNRSQAHLVIAPKIRTVIVHETKVKTVHVPAKRPASSSQAPSQIAPQPAVAIPQQQRPTVVPVRSQPVVIQTPTKVRSRVSPVGGGGESEGSDRGEGGSEGGDD